MNKRIASRHRIAVAVAGLLLGLAAPSGQAAITVTGGYSFDPGGTLPIGAGPLYEPGRVLWIGNGAGDGSFAAMAGSTVDLAGLFVAANRRSGSVLLDGAGTRLTLWRDNQGSRLELGNFGDASLVMSGGALLDARSAPCLSGYCGSVVSNSAGSTAMLRVTGAGTQASFLQLGAGNPGVDNRYDFGHAGLSSQGRIEVLDGAALTASAMTMGSVFNGPYGANGMERGSGVLEVAGAGTAIRVDGRQVGESGLYLGVNERSDGQATVRDGALLRVSAEAGQSAAIKVGAGGTGNMTITGAGSRVQMQSDAGRARLQVAEGGTGALALTAGGVMSGVDEVNVGLAGGTGTLSISSAGSALVGTGPASRMVIGNGWDGSWTEGTVRVTQGGLMQLGSIAIGRETGNSRGSLALDGVGTRVELSGVNTERLHVGTGAVTVSNGAVLSTRANEAACAGGVWCSALIGAVAGGAGTLTVTGAGSLATFTGQFQAGVTALATQADDGWTLGTPGGVTTARVDVLNGGVLHVDRMALGLGTFSAGATGSEAAMVSLAVRGAGSRLEVTGGDMNAALVTVSWNAKNTQVLMDVSKGGVIALNGAGDDGAVMSLSQLPGYTRLNVSGSGSAITFAPKAAAAANTFGGGYGGGVADISFSAGASFSGFNALWLGNDGQATLRADGAGTTLTSSNTWASLQVGTRGGNASATLSGGAQALLHTEGNTLVGVGLGTNSAGTAAQGRLTVTGPGTLLSLKSTASGSIAFVGQDGNGSLTVSNGAQLRIESQGPAYPQYYWHGAGIVVAESRTAPAQGQVVVTGAGSRIDTLGTNPFISVGATPNGTGLMTVSNGAIVQTTLFGVGDYGATGSLRIDNATVRLDGQWNDTYLVGASMAVGNGTGSVGTLTLANGGQLLIHNAGDQRTNLSIGGPAFSPGGSGVLDVSGGSHIDVSGAAGGQFVMAATSGSVGIARIAGGGTLTTNYVGIGALNGVDGGVATLLVQDTSTVTADTFEIGTKGFIGGTGTLIGNFINRGTVSPGNSPGTLHFQGDFSNQAGGRLVLEVESDGHGGFVTDHLVFDAGSSLSLAALQVEFRFLAATDPNAFQATGGFTIDSFLSQGGSALDHSLLTSATYSASSTSYQFMSFSFSADGGAVFQAQAVPEPGAWMMMLCGLGLGGWLQRRRAAGH